MFIMRIKNSYMLVLRTVLKHMTAKLFGNLVKTEKYRCAYAKIHQAILFSAFYPHYCMHFILR